MALSIVKELLQQYLQSLLNEGTVSYEFYQIHTSKSLNEQDSIEQWINTYCTDIEAILSELTNRNDFPDVDFSQLALLTKQMEDKSSRFGAEYVRVACADLVQACDQMHKRSFSRALSWIKDEFARTKNKLEPVIQMERRIMRLKAKQQVEPSPDTNF